MAVFLMSPTATGLLAAYSLQPLPAPRTETRTVTITANSPAVVDAGICHRTRVCEALS